jgi:hypothetical protein
MKVKKQDKSLLIFVEWTHFLLFMHQEIAQLIAVMYTLCFLITQVEFGVAYIELGLVLYCRHIIFICGAWLRTTVGESFERSPEPLAVSP